MAVRIQGEELSVTGEVMPELSIYGSALFLTATSSMAHRQPSRHDSDANRQRQQIENVPKRQFSIAGSIG